MKYYTVLYLSTFLVMTLLDLIWIGGIARNFYKIRLGEMMEFHLVPAVLFYVMYVVGIIIFVQGGDKTLWPQTAIYGALFGFFTYATYDLTNLATLKNWSVSLVIVDILWGSCVTAVAATAGKLITGIFKITL